MKVSSAIAFLTPVVFGIIWSLWTLCFKLNYPGPLTFDRVVLTFFLAAITLGVAVAVAIGMKVFEK